MSWEPVTLGAITTPVDSVSPSAVYAGDFDYIDIASIDRESKRITESKRLPASEAPSRARQLVRAGDVIISTVRPNLNAVAIVPERLDGAIASTGFCVLRANQERTLGRFLLYRTRTPDFIRSMVSQATGASYPAVNDRIVKSDCLKLPHFREQAKIVDILDQADALRDSHRSVEETAQRVLPSVFTRAFGHPSDWSVFAPLSQLADEFRYGTSISSSDTGKPALRIPNVVGGAIDATELKLVPVEDREFERLRLIDGDLLFVRTNGNRDYVARCAVFEKRAVATTGFPADEFIFASYLIRARFTLANVSPRFLSQYFATPFARSLLSERIRTSAGQFNINTEGLGSMPVPQFEVAAQQRFADTVERVEEILRRRVQAGAQLDILFQNLLVRAFDGRLTTKWREAHSHELLEEMAHQKRKAASDTRAALQELRP